MDSEVIRVSLKRKHVKVILEDDSGSEMQWTLRELDGTERNRYLNRMSSRVKIGSNGQAIGIKSFDGFQADLLKLSLLDEQGETVSVEAIEALPSSTQQVLFERAQDLSGLNVSAEDVSKND